MNEIVKRRHRREPMDLQLTSLIDVFSMLVIFLVLTTVLGAPEIIIPSDLRIPRSASKDALAESPGVTIGKADVRYTGLPDPIALDGLGGAKARIKESVEKSFKPGARRVLNVIADRGTPYKTVFDVVRTFREAGFETLVFVADGGGK